MTLRDEVARYVTTDDGLELAVYEDGPADGPVVVFVHGYPDNHRVWDGVANQLAGDFRVVRYDVRGAGESGTPQERSGYRIEQLIDDLRRVIDAVSPDAPVDLVAHDWGSIQAWDALTVEKSAARVRSYTSISGPSLDQAAIWIRGLRHGARRRIIQALESYYIGIFLTPRLPELLARRGVISRAVRHSATLGTSSQPAEQWDAPDLKDLVNGIELYRANIPHRLVRPRPPEVRVPVQVITPTLDVHVSAALAAEAPAPYVPDLTIEQLEANHWVVAQQPAAIAELIRRFIERPARADLAK